MITVVHLVLVSAFESSLLLSGFFLLNFPQSDDLKQIYDTNTCNINFLNSLDKFIYVLLKESESESKSVYCLPPDLFPSYWRSLLNTEMICKWIQ